MHKMHVLNTRPSHQSQNLSQLIKQAGGAVFDLPIIDIQPIEFEPIILDDFDYLIFQSSNAVDHFFHASSEKTTRATIIAIGSATQKALNKAGFDNVLLPLHFSSDGVLAMSLMQSVIGKSILIICGENPKSLLHDALTERGAKVKMLCCYQRIPALHDMAIVFPKLLECDINVIVSTSLESFYCLMRLFQASEHNAWLISKTVCVINEKMKDAAKIAGFTSVIQADNATDEAIVSCCQAFRTAH